jgi:hypothetical protein
MSDGVVEWSDPGTGGEAEPIPIAVATQGSVQPDDVVYATDRIGTLLRHVGQPVLLARLRLTQAADPARVRPAIAQVALDIDGELVRAHVAGHDMREAADLLQERLRDQLDHRAEHREDIQTRSGISEPGEWRHGDLRASRPEYYDRPVDERQLVRHKAFAVGELNPDEAVFDMEQLDHDFHLFSDLATGEDALMQRAPDGSYQITRLHPVSVVSGPTSIPFTVAQDPPPVLGAADAIQRLNDGGEPFVFFADEATGRGNVVYRRYDGHYGLIAPA